MNSNDPDIAFNKERWEELSASNIQYSVPALNLDPPSARKMIDPEGMLKHIENAEVLCLAASGGQQSAAFGILKAKVTVFDLSNNQLKKDEVAVNHYKYNVKTMQGDMQDLSIFTSQTFDVIWLAHSINFVPKIDKVLSEIARICRTGGKVRLNFTNPYVHGMWAEPSGNGFLLSQPYIDGAQIHYAEPYWTFTDQTGIKQRVEGPKEYRHSLSTIIKGLIQNGFEIDGMWEEVGTDPNPEVGSWEHFKKIAPPWLTIWVHKK
jgi:ubiquinone/menaquinone biosynthesis C-methylase UbiE